MNAPGPHQQEPILLLLVGGGRVGKDTIGTYLKQHHGFAKAAFTRPLYDGIQSLYGVSPIEYLAEDKDARIPRLSRSVRELLQRLGDHVRSECGQDLLIRRLVERAVARGEWMQTDLVITDGRTDLEVEWVRQQGGAIWWIYRPDAQEIRPHHTESIAALRVKQFSRDDMVLTNEGPVENLYMQVDAAVLGLRQWRAQVQRVAEASDR